MDLIPLVAKIALGPLLLVQGRRVRRDALRLPEPEGPRVGETGSGQRLLRLLMVGDSAIAGVGVSHQREALARNVVDALAPRLAPMGIRLGWRLLARSGIDTAEALEMLDAAWLADPSGLRADVAFVGLGVNDVTGQVPVARRLRSLEDIVGRLHGRHGVRIAIVSGLPPMHRFPALPQPLRWYLGACAKRHDRALRDWADARREASPGRSLRAMPVPDFVAPGMVALDGFHPSPAGYRVWSESIARTIAEIQPEGTPIE